MNFSILHLTLKSNEAILNISIIRWIVPKSLNISLEFYVTM